MTYIEYSFYELFPNGKLFVCMYLRFNVSLDYNNI